MVEFSITNNKGEEQSIISYDALSYLSIGIDVNFVISITDAYLRTKTYHGTITKDKIICTGKDFYNDDATKIILNKHQRDRFGVITIEHYILNNFHMSPFDDILLELASALKLTPIAKSEDEKFIVYDFSKIFTYKEFGKYDLFH